MEITHLNNATDNCFHRYIPVSRACCNSAALTSSMYRSPPSYVVTTRALHGSALDNGSKWYGMGVPRFFKWYGIWYLCLRYLMVRLPTPRFFTVSQHCGKQMARYMVTITLRGRQTAPYMVTISLRGRQMVRYMVTFFVRGRQMARYMVLRSISFLRGRQTARLR